MALYDEKKWTLDNRSAFTHFLAAGLNTLGGIVTISALADYAEMQVAKISRNIQEPDREIKRPHRVRFCR